MSAARQLHDDFCFGHKDPSSGVEEPAEDLSGLRLLVAMEGFREPPIDAAGDYGQEDIEVHIQGDGRREGIEVEEIHGIGETVFDEHPLGAYFNQIYHEFNQTYHFGA